MFRQPAPAWQLSCDVDTGLQCAASIGRHIQVHPSEPAAAQAPLQHAWHHWWNQLTKNTLHQVAHRVKISWHEALCQLHRWIWVCRQAVIDTAL